MQEIWKDIPGYEGRYQVSNMGRVKSLKYKRTNKEGVLKPHLVRGYHLVEIFNDSGENKVISIHRLVAQVFIPNPMNKPEVNHIDGVRNNNIVSNLEWVTQRENVNHFYRTLRGKPFMLRSGRHLNWQWKSVRCVETGEVFPTIASAAQKTGVSERAISRLLKNPPNRHTAGGYHWELAN